MKKSVLIISIILFYSCTNISQIDGLLDEVEVLRDKYGINHIYANNQNDLFFMQGYLAAKDRLFQFEIWRRQATGTVSEIFGEDELDRDLGTRLFKFRGNMEDELNHYHEDGFEIVSSFVSGINKYIEEINKTPSQLPIEFNYNSWFVQSPTPGMPVSVTEEVNHFSRYDCNPPNSFINHANKNTKELLKVTDLLGRETKQTNQPLFYIYDDGTVEKRIVIE